MNGRAFTELPPALNARSSVGSDAICPSKGVPSFPQRESSRKGLGPMVCRGDLSGPLRRIARDLSAVQGGSSRSEEPPAGSPKAVA